MPTPARKGLALADRASHLRLWLTVAVGVLLDLATKSIAWHRLGAPLEPGGRGESYEAIPAWLMLVTSKNPGIVFGIDFVEDLGLGPLTGRALTVLLTAGTSILILYLFAKSHARQRWMHLWCGLVLAGALGNLFDRLAYGYVRDFIQITRTVTIAGRTFGWPYIFNFADLYLVIGVAAAALTCLLAGDEAESKRRRRTDR